MVAKKKVVKKVVKKKVKAVTAEPIKSIKPAPEAQEIDVKLPGQSALFSNIKELHTQIDKLALASKFGSASKAKIEIVLKKTGNGSIDYTEL